MKNKKNIVLIVLLLTLISNVEALSIGDSFFNIRKWDYPNKEVVAEIRVDLTVINISDNEIEILIAKDMTPFPETVVLKAKARYEMGKYVFTSVDGWGNYIFGYFTIEKGETAEDEKITLFLDIMRRLEGGNNAGRLYGGSTVLIKSKIPFE